MNFGNPSPWNKTHSCLKTKQVAINSKSICIMWRFVLGHRIKILLERSVLRAGFGYSATSTSLVTGSFVWIRWYHFTRHWFTGGKNIHIPAATKAALPEKGREVCLDQSLWPILLFGAHLLLQRTDESSNSTPAQILTLPFAPHYQTSSPHAVWEKIHKDIYSVCLLTVFSSIILILLTKQHCMSLVNHLSCIIFDT